MKNPSKTPAWMKSGRPDTIHKNCLNVQDGLVEACDFDPAMCQACETKECKWHPSKLDAPSRDDEDEDEEDDEDSDEGSEDGSDDDTDAEER